MNSFSINKIHLDSETVAEILRSTRQERGLKLEKIAKELNINIKYLNALEHGNFSQLPTGVYGKNFLREYAIFLRLDYHPLVKMFENEANLTRQEQQQELFSKQVVKAHYFLTVPRIVKNVIILLVVSVCLIYLGYRLGKIVSPPTLALDNPVNNLATKDHSIEVIGTTESESQLTINNEPVMIDSAGHFEKTVDLKEGMNEITVIANKKYGRSVAIKRQILVE